jgi:hypothetical protein
MGPAHKLKLHTVKESDIMKGEIEVSKRKAAFTELRDWCVMSVGSKTEDRGDFIEVTEWSNGEGYDIFISDGSGERQFNLTWGQFKALQACIKKIDK